MEGSREEGMDGERSRDEMITADYCVATVQSCCTCPRGGR